MAHSDPARASGFAEVMERNVRALHQHRAREERRMGWQDRIADRITRFTGSMLFVYIHLILFGAWIIVNLPFVPFPWKWDPEFIVLAMWASVEAIFLSTFVLISQNRMSALAEKRAELDLQISLLAEHEVTRIVTLVTAIGRKLGIEESHDPELHELQQDVRPDKVLESMERVVAETEERLQQDASADRELSWKTGPPPEPGDPRPS